MSPPTPHNTKRYWGDEKNIDSIYSIYLKKISYAYHNDISFCAIKDFDDTHSTASTSSADLVRSAKKCNSNNKNSTDINESNCHKQADTPRGRKNFFQKYRRRSCSVDKYSFEKNKNKTSTPFSGKTSKNMRQPGFGDKLSLNNEELSVSHDDIDGFMKVQATSDLKQQASGKSLRELSNQSSQSLQWETRQIKVLQAATLDHVLKFILLINSSRDLNNLNTDPNSAIDNSVLEEERNNVAHIIHVLFCTYRIYTNPYELMLKLMDYSDISRIEQYRFVMHYWMDNYPEDFEYIVDTHENSNHREITCTNSTNNTSISSFNNSITSYDSSTTNKTTTTSDSETNNVVDSADNSQSGTGEDLNRRLSNLSIKNVEKRSGTTLVIELIKLCRDEYIREKAMKLNEIKQSFGIVNGSHTGSNKKPKSHLSGNHQSSNRNSAVLDLDSRYVAQQLTAIDLENFLCLKPYSLLEGTKSDTGIQSMIKNFNLLSRHVVVTILKSHNPHTVASHWIAIALNLRKIKNFNSLKAIIAGLTNESIYRLKQVIWAKIDRTSLTNFKLMASIVDDVNNQTVLRQTQLIVEGTAKMSIEDDSFGTIPYLGTFLTDLNMIDARYPTYIPSPKDETLKLKLINFEKCAKQFEILTQVQLLQKNVLASLHAIQRRNHFDEQTTLNRLRLEYNNQNHQMLLAKPAIPQVSRLFENWFYDVTVASMTDKQW